MFDWITKPQLMWTPIDSLLAVIECLIAIYLLTKLFILIVKIIDYFDRKEK